MKRNYEYLLSDLNLLKGVGTKTSNLLKRKKINTIFDLLWHLPTSKIETSIAGSGKGKFDLYNKTIPSYMKKYAKKWNAKVYDDNIPYFTDKVNEGIFSTEVVTNAKRNDIPVTVLELSDGMKKDVVSSSQPLFEIFGTVSLSTWAANEVSDSMENNIISQTTNNMY